MPDLPPTPWTDEQAQALVQALLCDRSGHAVIFTDGVGRISGWSAGAHALTGWTADEAIGKPIAAFFTAEDREHQLDRQELRAATAVGYSEDDRWHLRKDGSRFWASGALVRTRAGFVKIFKNATHLRARACLMENRLQAERDRHRADLADLAHDLQESLAALRSAFETLLRRPASAQAREAGEIVGRELGALGRRIEGLPDRGRPRPGKPSLDLRRFDLVKLVSMAVVACESQAQAHRVRLRCVLPPGPLEVVVDPLRITQVVTHLVSNAIECSPPDAEVVVLATESEPHFVVRVQDQGCGIEPVLLPRILDVFTRADDAEEGAGAGLGVVKEIVRLHGGSVEVRSDGAGAGSEFCVRIPIAGSDAAGAPRAAVPCASDTGDGIGRA